MIDYSGIYGSLISYMMTIVFVVSALMIFLHLWSKGKLGIDEEAKDQMMQQREEYHEQR